MKTNKYYIETTCCGEYAILNSKSFKMINNKFYKNKKEANKALKKINK